MEEEILEHVKVIRRRLLIMSILAWVKVVIIAVPIILALIWLPSRVRTVWGDYEQYKGQVDQVLGGAGSTQGLLESFFNR